MPLSRDPAALLLLFQNRPTLALELLRQVFGVETEAAGPAQIDTDRAVIYFDLIRAALSEAARKAVDAMISQKYEFQSDFALRYLAEGKAEGTANAVIGVLEARGIALRADERAWILACTDLAVLGTWVRRAVSVTRAAELLE